MKLQLLSLFLTSANNYCAKYSAGVEYIIYAPEFSLNINVWPVYIKS